MLKEDLNHVAGEIANLQAEELTMEQQLADAQAAYAQSQIDLAASLEELKMERVKGILLAYGLFFKSFPPTANVTLNIPVLDTKLIGLSELIALQMIVSNTGQVLIIHCLNADL